ncbi:MAG TPA: UDP-N-acetylglucosamine 2-epimerase (non-hydrolyzing) [Phycisphaerae bacterium]|nr:UDP-N-acetylglucosamine 2-epimerase (non-hydrolyzing) [Phycisphaerae bacterium]HNU45186.1 UDP-N-acetylglucosamine 2-epimerase (non-hydrolyzing) [Phycisphaerae bacterium]
MTLPTTGPFKVCFVIGTRPEAIKVWSLVVELKRRADFDVQVVLSGQHRELLRQAVGLLGLPVTLDLDVMQPAQSLERLTATLVERVSEALAQLRPDAVIVQGDTTTVFVGALAAFYAQIPVGHLEAGLRSGDVRHPFPEEMNRRLTSALADWHFTPTQTARQTLLAEGVPAERIWVTGNTGIDALRLMHANLDRYPGDPRLAAVLACPAGRLLAVTVHRRENQPFMRRIAEAFARVLELHRDIRIVFPVHFSPAVRAAFTPVLGDQPRCHLLEPVDYADFVRLLARSHLVLTDSGGVQEEAPHLGKPVLVLRRTTERPEAVSAGVARLVGDEPDAIVAAVTELLTDAEAYRRMARRISPYGDGYASPRIADILTHSIRKRGRS